MRTVLLASLALLAVGAEAAAGAWPRGAGAAFVSAGHTASVPRAELSWRGLQAGAVEPGGYSTLFAEYGLDPDVTIGLDFGRDTRSTAWTGLVFLRRSFATEGPDVWAVELAMGSSVLADGSAGVVLRPGLHWGRGTEWGWLSAESYVERRSEAAGLAYKVDATLGWNVDERRSLVTQVQAADYPGVDPIVRLAPSLVQRSGERLRTEFGIVADVTGRDEVGLSVGTWLDF